MRAVNPLSAMSSLIFVTMALAQGPGMGGGAAQARHNTINMIRIAHAALGSAAWVFFFPLGSILIRTLDGTKTVWIHAAIQLFSVALVTASVGLGIQLALDLGEISEYHCIIGLVLFVLLFGQIVGGIIHHVQFRKRGYRTTISHLHIWLGRAIITLGMINGGLGLLLAADADDGDYIAYGVVAGCIWTVWMAVDVRATLKKKK